MIPDEPYKDVLVFPETRKVSLFKNSNYQVSVSIAIHSSWMRQIICVLDSGMGANVIRPDPLDPTWLDSIRQENMPNIRCASLM